MAPLAPIGNALVPWMIGGGIVTSAIGQYQAGQAAAAQAEGAKAMAEYNAKLAEREAMAVERQTEYAQKRKAEAAARYAGSLRAGMGAAGVVPGEGTPLLIEAKQAAQAELENLMLGYQGQIAAGRARSQASLDRLQASIYGQRASNLQRAGYLGAGTTLLTGFGDYAARKYGY